MSNVPKLRFPPYKDQWCDIALGDVGKVSMCKRILKHQTSPKGDIPFFKIGTFGKVADAFITQSLFEEYKERFSYPSKGDILIAASGATYGKTVKHDGRPSYFQDSNIVWIANDESLVLNGFLHLIYQRIKWPVEESTIPRLYNGTISSANVRIPTVTEQKKISDFLTAVDTKIEQLIRKEELLKQYKKGVMQKIFSQEIRFKADDGSEFPEWDHVKLGNLIIQESKRNRDKKIGLVLSVSNKKGFITQAEQFDDYEVASKDTSNYKVVANGQYAYNPSRINVGSLARLKTFEEGIVSPMYVVFSLSSMLRPVFFDNLYQTHRFKHLIKVGCSGSVRDSLNFDDLASFELLLPSLAEQEKIEGLLYGLDVKINELSKYIETAKTFKKGLLQQMFV